MKLKKWLAEIIMMMAGVSAAAADPGEVFANPPPEAHPGVWWHWMGQNVTTNGIRADLAYFKRMGITSATIFGMTDICTPWATDIPGGATPGLVAFTPRWWAFVRYAAEEGKRQGIDIGLHNCPGYTSTGGPWITPELAMRELVFNAVTVDADGKTVTAEVPRPKVKLEAQAPFPVVNGETGRLGKPEIPSRRTDMRDIALLAYPADRAFDPKDVRDLTKDLDAATGTVKAGLPAGKWTLLRVLHTPTGSFTQPTQWAAFGLECDKMSEEAVRFHLDHVIGALKANLGPLVGTGLKHLLLDSYEAGYPTWTPKMREEFKARRGYDPLPWLPILAGMKNVDKKTAEKFRNDFDRTIRDLYRDKLFKIMGEETRKAGLAFACEPYTGPFDTDECAKEVDRLMTEFWSDRKPTHENPGRLNWEERIPNPEGQPRHVIEAEAFTAQPQDSMWDETPERLKPVGDHQFCRGVNRFIFHTNPLQPWDDNVKPGIVMGRWGTHFGRTQTWAEPAKAYFDYLARCQALLQWGRPAGVPHFEKETVAHALAGRGRTDGKASVFFVANMTDRTVTGDARFDAAGLQAEWFDPVTGTVTPAPDGRKERNRTWMPLTMGPYQSGFMVFHNPTVTAPMAATSPCTVGQAARSGTTITGPWTVTFDPAWGGPAAPVTFEKLEDWTRNADPAIRYYSGTAVYRTTFALPGTTAETLKRRTTFALPGATAGILKLGDTNKQVARVKVNGKDLGVVWCEPHQVALPAGLLKAKGNVLEIEFTNVWANRLIGDEQEAADCEWKEAPMPGGSYLVKFPEWFREGKPRLSAGRKCFTTWKHFTKDSKLVPSGLMGPVEIN